MICVIGDIHTKENDIEEIELVLQEIFDECLKRKINKFFFLGDIFDRKRPSPIEYDFVTKWMRKFQIHGSVTIVSGNHDAVTDKNTALDFSRHFGIILENDKCIKVIGDKSIYLGHHATDQGDEFVKDKNYKLKDLKKFDLAFLGHLHNFHKLADNVIHLGAIRKCNFGEIDYPQPRIALINEKDLKIEYLELKSPFPMKDVSVTEIKKIVKFGGSQSKIRLVLKGYEEFLGIIDDLPKISKNFYNFTVKHDYKKDTQVIDNKEVKKKDFDQIFKDYLKTVANKEVKEILKECYSEKK